MSGIWSEQKCFLAQISVEQWESFSKSESVYTDTQPARERLTGQANDWKSPRTELSLAHRFVAMDIEENEREEKKKRSYSWPHCQNHCQLKTKWRDEILRVGQPAEVLSTITPSPEIYEQRAYNLGAVYGNDEEKVQKKRACMCKFILGKYGCNWKRSTNWIITTTAADVLSHN